MKGVSLRVQAGVNTSLLGLALTGDKTQAGFHKEDDMRITKTQAGVPTLVRDVDDMFDRFLTGPLPFPAYGFEPMNRALEVTLVPALDLT